MRKWFLLNDGPTSGRLRDLVRHIPCTDFRSPSVLKLFIAGFQCDFKLTTSDGHPTPALRLMAKLMGAQLCQVKDFPAQEKKAFGKDDGTLINRFDETWYLRGIAFSDRVKAAQASTALPVGRKQWHWVFLPNLDGALIHYKVDGKRRQRQCWIASCRPDWEMSDDVYDGLFRWTRECLGPPERYRGFGDVPWPDAYTLIREDPALRSAGDEGTECGAEQEPGAAPAECLQAPAVEAEHGSAERALAAAGG